MRTAIVVVAVFGLAGSAFAQQSHSRVELGPVVRLDGLYFEGGTTGTVASGGISARTRVSSRLAIDAELTQGGGRVERSYEGWFVSYVTTPNPSREEVERFAPTARRTLGYEPGPGWTVALVVKDLFKTHLPVNFRVGASGRQYHQTSDYVVLTIPAGVDPARVARDFQSSDSDRIRGGLLLGTDVPLQIGTRWRIVPGGHLVWGGPAQVGNAYREAGFTLRGSIGF